jgi:hypothetical protein
MKELVAMQVYGQVLGLNDVSGGCPASGAAAMEPFLWSIKPRGLDWRKKGVFALCGFVASQIEIGCTKNPRLGVGGLWTMFRLASNVVMEKRLRDSTCRQERVLA